jgi:MSHA biogenesis protein MshI
LLAESFQFENINNLPLILTGFIKKHELYDVPAYWLLPPDAYQLFLLESLPVPKDEFWDALNWRVRSLISYPIEEATLDYFTIPEKKASSNNTMIAVVTANVNDLKRTVDIFQHSGVNLTTIDIPELALRNLTSLYENDEKSTAFIYFYNNFAILNITRQTQLYFTRRINVGDHGNPEANSYEEISLEIIRYFDYYQSQWRHPSPSRVFVASITDNADTIATYLSQQLLITVEKYKLKSIITTKDKLPQFEQNDLLTLGCALRKDNGDATSGN